MRDFRQLDVWKQSLALVKSVYETTAHFPGTEKYGLVTQMNRSAVSVPSNIAEGCSRKTSLEFSRFLEIAIGSSFELETLVEISYITNLIIPECYAMLIKELHILQKRLNKLRGCL
jgi:four helix bundle protein